MTIYDSDPGSAPDSAFVGGDLGHVVVGNRGRLLDARRTPVSITAVMPDRAEFELRIGAFEDEGARWQLPLWEIGRFQFAPDSRRAPEDVVADVRTAVADFHRAQVIDPDTSARDDTLDRIGRHRAAARELLVSHGPARVDLEGCITRRQGDARLWALLERFLAERDLADLDRRFCETIVSNPRSGELVKGHAIVLAQLGLCRCQSTIVRDPELFSGATSRVRRSEHLVARLAFTQELWSTCVGGPVTLYRAAAVDGPLPDRAPASFVSCTFSQTVAAAHFGGGPSTETAVMWRQQVGLDRLLMTFLETRTMNAGFREAEALLIADPDNRAF